MHRVAFAAVEPDCRQIVVSRAADLDCRKIAASVAADLDCRQLAASVAAVFDGRQVAAFVAACLPDTDMAVLAVAAGVACCKDPAGTACVEDAGWGIEVADLACVAAVADTALAETKVAVEARAEKVAAAPAVESAAAAAAQAGQPEDKLPGLVAPGAPPDQLGQTACQAVKKPLVRVPEPAQGSLAEDPPARGVLPLQHPASRTGSHSSPGSSSTALPRRSALSRAQGESGHQGQTEGPMHLRRPPEPPCQAREEPSSSPNACLPTYAATIMLFCPG